MCLSAFNLSVPAQCALATVALQWQGEECGDCCAGPPPAANQIDPCNVVLETTLIQQLFSSYHLAAALAANVPPTDADLRQSLSPTSLALVLVDLGVFHYMLVYAYDPLQALYSVANPASLSGGLVIRSWPELNGGAGMQYLWRITTLPA